MEQDTDLSGDLATIDPKVILQKAWFTDHAIERMLERHPDLKNAHDPRETARKLLLAAKEEPAKTQEEQAARVRATINNGFNQTRFFSNSGCIFVVSRRKRKKHGGKKSLSVVTIL